jgi:hypothetical protein
MAGDRVFGDIATKLVMENDRVRIWAMRLEPGDESDLHRHDHDDVMIQISGDTMAARFEPDSGESGPASMTSRTSRPAARSSPRSAKSRPR